MYTNIVKKPLLFISLFVVVAMACDMSVSVAPSTSAAPLPTNIMNAGSASPTSIPPSVTSLPATADANTTSPTPEQSFEGVEVSVAPVSIVLPPGLASGVRDTQFPRADEQDLPYWSLTPGHTLLKLEGYLLQGKSHEAEIYIYPALDYAVMVPGAFESIHRLDNMLYAPGGPMLNDQLPAIPFFNAQQVFASKIQLISFQNGQGVRFVTEYAQYPASANNNDLFYHFQGVTRDGDYYIVAILPITAPELAETSDGGAALPSGGVPYPYFANPGADMQSYYTSVVDVLNAAPAESFSPTIGQLDLLIQSMKINP
jgi:hypothetical protein